MRKFVCDKLQEYSNNYSFDENGCLETKMLQCIVRTLQISHFHPMLITKYHSNTCLFNSNKNKELLCDEGK